MGQIESKRGYDFVPRRPSSCPRFRAHPLGQRAIVESSPTTRQSPRRRYGPRLLDHQRNIRAYTAQGQSRMKMSRLHTFSAPLLPFALSKHTDGHRVDVPHAPCFAWRPQDFPAAECWWQSPRGCVDAVFLQIGAEVLVRTKGRDSFDMG